MSDISEIEAVEESQIQLFAVPLADGVYRVSSGVIEPCPDGRSASGGKAPRVIVSQQQSFLGMVQDAFKSVAKWIVIVGFVLIALAVLGNAVSHS